MTPQQEKELLEKIRADPRQFGMVFDQWYKPIFGYVFRRLGEYDPTCDIVSETFLCAFLKIGSFQWKGVSISAWLYKIATNEINQFRRNKKYRGEKIQSLLELERLPTGLISEKEQLEEELAKHHEFVRIQDELRKLDTKYQDVIALRFFEKKDILEIAQILEKPDGTIKSLLSRGLEKLRKQLIKTEHAT